MARRPLARLAPLMQREAKPLELPPPLLGAGFVIVETDAGSFWMPAGDEVMRPYMQRRKAWDENVGAALTKIVQPGCRFLDVGAAIGYFSVFAAGLAPGVKVDSVEPNPESVSLLRFNLWLNRVPASVWPTALASQRGSLPLTGSATNLGDARTTAPEAEAAYPLVVPSMSADELFAGRAFDVVKIDVQGYEEEVLLGMQRILHESPAISILTEFWPSALRSRDLDPGDALDRYRRFDLDIAVLRDGQLDSLPNRKIIEMCDSAGVDGQVDLLLHRRPRPG